ncbi:MAG: WD40 repeat domain-containing protein [Rhabdochlamydiaceae bacterium]|jgi:WD40 repeat protein
MSSNITPVRNPLSLTTNSPFVKAFSSKDIFRLICSHLSAYDLVQFTSANKRLYTQILPDPLLWNLLLQKCFPSLYVASQSDSKYPLEVYQYLTRINKNMRTGNYQLRVLTEHKDAIAHISIYENNFISVSYKDTIKIWDLMSGKELQSTFANKKSLANKFLHKNKCISASSENIITILDLGSEEKLQLTHEGWVSIILMHGDKLISVSDNTIKIWDFESGKELQRLTGHRGAINSILMHEGRLFSRSFDGAIEIWDLESGKELQTLPCNRMLSSLVHRGLRFSASSDFTIDIRDDKSGKELQNLKGHQNQISFILMHDDKLISASRDRTIKIWDFDVPSLPLSSPVPAKNLAIPKKQSPEEVAFLLAALGINNCSTQLQIGSSFLQDVGIRSLADIEALGLSLHDFQHLVALDEVKEGDRNKRQAQALAKSEPIFILLQTLLDAVDQRIRESMNCTLPPYENDRDNPWIALREELIDYLDKFKHERGAPVTLLEKFKPDNYAQVISDVNGLVDGFKATDCLHRIARLRTYVGQYGLNLAWIAIHDEQEIDSLAALVERTDIAPQDLFAMGI